MWWITHNAHGAFTARGVHGQTIYIDPKAEMVIARYASHPVAGNAANDPASLPAYHALAKFLMGESDGAGTPASGQAADYLKAFPPAGAGMVRHVLTLPVREDEPLRQVELIVGKTVETDLRNRYFFGGRIEAEIIQGWGFTRYVVKDLGPMAGTRMAAPPDAPQAARFVTLGGEPYLVRYNSQLPIVVYAPEGAGVRYRVWSSTDETEAVPEG
jgi:ecotin